MATKDRCEWKRRNWGTILANGGHDGLSKLIVESIPAPNRLLHRVVCVCDQNGWPGESGVQHPSIQMALLLVVVVHCVHNVLLFWGCDAPNASPQQMPCCEWSDGETLPRSCIKLIMSKLVSFFIKLNPVIR
jgi:hypothetical protein